MITDQWSMHSICFGFWLRSIYPIIQINQDIPGVSQDQRATEMLSARGSEDAQVWRRCCRTPTWSPLSQFALWSLCHHYRCQHDKPGSKTSEESPEAGYRDESKEERQHAPETVRVGNLEELCTVSVHCDDQSVYWPDNLSLCVSFPQTIQVRIIEI